MSLWLHYASGTSALASGLADMMTVPLADPFAEEIVVVPAKGIERWLSQRLSHTLGASTVGGDGVCAGVRFLNPSSLVGLVTGQDDNDPWGADRLVWPLLEVVDACAGEAWCATLSAHLGLAGPTSADPLAQRAAANAELIALRQDRRYSVMRRIAGLLAGYASQRPSLLADWEDGRDTDGAGGQLARDLLWQAELWRRVVASTAAPTPGARHRAAVAAIALGQPLLLPDRLSLFGHTRLSVTELELVRSLADVRDVHLWLPQASPAAWDTLAEHYTSARVHRREDNSAQHLNHPLLASLGRDSRELQRSLALLGPGAAVSEHPPVEPQVPETLLGWLQADLRADEIGAAQERALAADDQSVQVHACHGDTRQIEVLREVLTGLMQDDPTLEPRDILVMCPDVEAYAPLFSAAFGLGVSAGPGAHPAHSLRVRLADRALLGTNPLLAVAAALLDIAGGRAQASEVLALASAGPVRVRFGLDEDSLDTLTTWVTQAGVRWGLTPELRAPFALEKFRHNTWQAGLDRILLGVAMAEDGAAHLGRVLPIDDVGSTNIEVAGKLAEFVDRLGHHVGVLNASEPLAEWIDALSDAVLDLGDTLPADQWQVAQLRREFASVAAAGQGRDVPLRLADLRTLIEHRTRPRPTRANFRTGNLTVSTMVPMRSVPHRVVALIGLDDGTFPRSMIGDGDDVLARDPLTGERDLRSEDRQLLLDAVLAAQETLVITYTGANEHSGAERPPAVPLGELLDSLELTATGGRAQAVTRHPLQPFDAKNFLAAHDAGRTPLFSFDSANLAGARTRLEVAGPAEPLLAAALPPVSGDAFEEVGMADLHEFLVHPVRAFLRRRLEVSLPGDYREIRDGLPVTIDALEAWAVGDRLLRDVIAGADRDEVLLAAQLRGDLPPEALGERTLKELKMKVGKLLEASAADRAEPPRSFDIAIDLGHGRRLTGVVSGVRGNRLVRVHYSSLKAKQRLASWVDLLALSAAYPAEQWTAHTYGWSWKTAGRSRVGPLDAARAAAVLAELVDVRDRGLCEPLPLPLQAGCAWATARAAGKEPLPTAREAWDGPSRVEIPGERDDAAHRRVFGRGAPLEALLGTPQADENWNDEPTRLGQYALRVWSSLVALEQVERL